MMIFTGDGSGACRSLQGISNKTSTATRLINSEVMGPNQDVQKEHYTVKK
jgi:hypothetical protein